jgi:hypothetical protein
MGRPERVRPEKELDEIASMCVIVSLRAFY